jgi:hypothetical protein
MRALELGDEVAVRNSDGSVGYEPVYAFGHRDNDTPSSFVEVTVTSALGDVDRSIQVGMVWCLQC